MAVIKKIMVAVFVLLLFLPISQRAFRWVAEPALQGDVRRVECPEWSWSRWWSGDWQQQTADCSRDQLGFFPSLIRSRNQLSWELFHQPRANKVVLGKDGFFFGSHTIEAWAGTDFKGVKHWINFTKKLKKFSDSLAVRNKQILVVLAPNKSSIYPEYLPEGSTPGVFDSTNYGALRGAMESLEVNFIDFDAWFRKIRDQHDCPLFLRGGIHWSEYGMKLGADSLYRKIEALTQRDLTDYELGPIEYYDQARGVDNDIIQSLNLFYPPLPERSCSFTFRWKEQKTSRPNLLVMSDSFYSRISSKNWRRKPFGLSDFWYYNRNFYAHPPKQNEMGKEVNQDEVAEYIQRYDLVILMASTGNLLNFDWGLTGSALRYWPPMKDELVRQD